ncbi:iron complex outermembrane recepter protein [Roseomonas rosea]|uniref:Iron complex outermembrane recepter protein n=1 Tax=Muricoccus roseus TaxID=198092 RepID=A0A1M6EQM6_9PROT|nr:TonB-dependent siderophore receptor [Roseomonas rosea]SHI87619.1 iron complex outermembrane recepter protein [Roseomonas rosea]
MTSLRRTARSLACAVTLAPAIAAGQTADSPEAGPVLVPEVRVESSGQTATGPVQGFVATEQRGATKTDTPLIETPQSVTVITRDRIEAQAVRSVSEALRYSAGVTSELSGFDPRFDDLRIRGFDARASQYLDGLRLLRQFGPSSVEQYGLERIEVVRGPSSVLYGQTAPGGLINLVTKRPTQTAFGEVNLSAGSHDRFQGSFDLGGPLTADGQFLYRLTGLVRNSDTQVSHVADDRYYIAPALSWRLDPNTTLTLLGRFQYDQGGSPIGLPAQGTLLPNRNGRIARDRYAGSPRYNRSDVSVASIGYEFQHRIDDRWSIQQNGRFLHSNVDYYSMYGSALSADQRVLTRGTLTQRESSDTWNFDTTVTGRFRTGPVQHTLLFGFDERLFSGNYQAHFGRGPSLDLFNPDYGVSVPDARIASTSVTNRDDRLQQSGLYLQDQIRIGNLILVAGGRLDWARTRQTPRATGLQTRQDDDAFTGRLAATYLFDSGFAPYLSYSTSFDPVVGAGAPQRGGSPFQPTEGEQYELGLKYQPPGMNSFVTASLFQLTQTNVSTRDPAYTQYSIQTGEVRVRGLELEATASLAEGLNLVGSYTYLDAEITSANDATRGNRPALVPTHQASLWADYRFGEGSFLPGFGIGAGVRHVGNRFGENANTLQSPGVTLADASVSYQTGPYKFTVSGSNIFDKIYVASCQGAFYCYYGTGRTVIGTLTYRW